MASHPLKRLRSLDENDDRSPHLKPRSDTAEFQHSDGEPTSNRIGSPSRLAIDLTLDDIDNFDHDVQMVDAIAELDNATAPFRAEESLKEEGEICFGTIFDANAAFSDDSSVQDPLRLLSGPDSAHRFSVFARQDYFALQSGSHDEFAVLDTGTTRALQALDGLASLRFQAVLEGGYLKGLAQRRKKGKRTVIPVSINIYGSKEVMQDVGKRLSKAHIYLQHPLHHDNVQYRNPHYFVLPGNDQEYDSDHPSPSEKDIQDPGVMNIDRLFEMIDHTQGLQVWNADWQIRTPLLEHQKKALHFLFQRERGTPGDAFSLWKSQTNSHHHYYQHEILGSRVAKVSNLPRGGILADDMGLGKTLTMISAIVMSLNEGATFARWEDSPQGSRSNGARRRAKSTLVIVPSPVLLDGWIEETQKHVALDSLKIYKYHGSSKDVAVDSILENDVVVTTYATIVSEVAKRSSLLHQLMWFRVILDEAHTIRHQSTQQFRAVFALHAQRRWCLTGTPIQNRLEDLGSLIKFLRVAPFDDNAAFRQHISEPLLTQSEDGDLSLRLLLGSMCLRRTRSLLDLPDAKEETFTSSLSTEEKSLYSKIIEDSRRAIDDSISSKSIAKAYNGILQAILRLRLLCNNGTQQLSDTIPDSQNSPTVARILENGKISCAFCSSEILVSDASDDVSHGASPSNLPYALCPACLSPNETCKSKDKRRLNMPKQTSAQCTQRVSPGEEKDPRHLSKDEHHATPPASHYYLREHSSKLSALVSNVKKDASQNKSLVFSCWKTTLGILEQMLQEAGMLYVRIDGSISASERSRIIKQFQEDKDTNLLLMTTGTGAVGLNLTAATRVHLVEPQWNPAIEAQAIGRAVRLGQTRSVTIIRYVTEKTIEEAIQSRQIMKLQLAELTLEKKGGNEQTMLQRLKDLRSLLHKY